MIIKKPLTGYSCASCDKDIVDLHSSLAQNVSINKFPTRRMSQLGQGFSNILGNFQLKCTPSESLPKLLTLNEKSPKKEIKEQIDDRLIIIPK